MYNIIGAIVLFVGILITPFLKYLIKGDYPADVNLYILFFMYLFNLVFGYFSMDIQRHCFWLIREMM